MKFWKLITAAALLICAVTTAIVYTACEKDPCNNVTCYNGGSCGNGVCHCPTGYENTQCQTKTTDRFVGIYPGYITCNGSAQILDTAFIYDNGGNNVSVKLNSLSPKILYGYISNNESTYSIVVTDNDSMKTGYDTYLKTYDITLQSDKELSIHTYEKYRIGTDTSNTQCAFLGYKVSPTP